MPAVVRVTAAGSRPEGRQGPGVTPAGWGRRRAVHVAPRVERVHRLVRVLVGDRNHLEAGVGQPSPDLPLAEEVLVVDLGEGVAVAVAGDLDARVARACADVHHARDREAPAVRLALDDRIGQGELHHGVRVHVEDEPASGPDPMRQGPQGRAQLGGGEVVQAVERRHRGVEDRVDRELRQRLLDQLRVGTQPATGAREHRRRGVHADDAIAEGDELGGHETGAAADVEDGAHAVVVRPPQLVQEGRPPAVAGVHDHLVVDPCEARVRVSPAHGGGRPGRRLSAGQMPSTLALAAANSSSDSTPCLFSCASSCSLAICSSCCGAAGAAGAGSAYCCSGWS